MFTEYGSVYLQPKLEKFLSAPKLDTEAIKQMFRNFMPDQEGWDHNNFYDFLQKFYTLNKALPATQKISLYFSDEPVSWDEFKNESPSQSNKYNVYYAIPPDGDFTNPRDRIMAMRIYTKLKSLSKATGKQQKALVIMNSRHAFGYLPQMDDPQYNIGYIGQNTAGYLIKWMPNKVANIMIHTATPSHLVQEGKWDAAFLVNNNESIAFNFNGNSFGNDPFDYGQIPENWGSYSQIFTGLIFYKPLQNYYNCTNINGFYSVEYKEIVKQRTLSTEGESLYKEIQNMWQEMESHPEDFCGKAYTTDFLSPMYNWVDEKK